MRYGNESRLGSHPWIVPRLWNVFVPYVVNFWKIRVCFKASTEQLILLQLPLLHVWLKFCFVFS